MNGFRLTMALCVAAGSTWAAPVEFNRDVRAILSKNCFACHGQDAKKRKGKLRMDTSEGAFASKKGVAAIVAGNVSESELWARINSEDPDEVMPPPESKKSLTDEEKQTLKRWIEQGAKYEKHWAFIAPKKLKVPVGAGNPIDAFLQRRLAKEGLKPAPLAKPEILVRRVYLDLTGLPPTPKELDAFLANPSLEKLIDDLMQRQTYGEHMARYWLDLARYADTHGLHLDNERSMWPYRDWVVRAFNQNLTFDKFTRWQLAGDLLPKPTLDQQIASGFNRCNVTTGEGGSITAEWIYRNAVDRTSTAVEVWMGMTAGCAVCHDHKFDPLSTKEYYSMYSFFHSAADPALDGNKINTPPVLKVPRPGDEERLAELDVKIKQVDQRIAQMVAKIKYVEPAELPNPPKPTTKETVWIEDAVPAKAVVQTSASASAWKFVVKPEPVYSGAKSTLLEAKGLRQVVFTGVNPPLVIEKSAKLFTYVYLDTLNPPKQIMLQFNNGNWEHRAYWGGDHIDWGKVKTGSRKHMGNLPETGKWVRLEVDPVTVSLKLGEKLNGWAYTQYDGKVYWDKGGIFSTVNPAADPAYSWKIWKSQKINERNKDLNDTLRKFIKNKTIDKWTDAEEKKLKQHWLGSVYKGASKQLKPINDEKAKLVAQQDSIRKNKAVTFVMADLPKPRQSFVMLRGQYDRPGEKVSRNVPAFLPPLPAKPKERDYNRLDFANWLVDGKHPLTARVAVNRIWQQFFGVGLVKTSADFGTQGELPMHPELLDWLAVQFVEDGWDVQRLVKRILTSHAYRQSSRTTPALLKKDPENRLLAHAPRFRLDAEVLRDQALSLSGLLVLTAGGRGVRPYQPPNIWEPVGFASSNTRNYKQGKGDDLYRRSIYTFLKRTAPAPFMTSFDAPSREQSCTVRSRSNTPMQALQLMNDVQHVEAARNLAQRILNGGGADDAARIR
ncbi:MAG TPA: DUF1553 domain-containing protein, partial [Verrucomicrobia bacterium]|nr:DUF1553 domain-containing protein [Verrucomicrobiota bacterium]